MKRYPKGILVRVLAAGPAKSGRTYTPAALQDVVDLIAARGIVPVNIGHAAGGPTVGRLVEAEIHDGAVWACLAGVDPRDLMGMRKGARDRGLPELGMSVKGEGYISKATGIVGNFSLLESVDLCSQSEPDPGAGGMVPFGAEGLPIGWEDRHRFWTVGGPAILESAGAVDARARKLDELEARLNRLLGRFVDLDGMALTEAVTPPLEEIAEKIRGLLNPPGATSAMDCPDSGYWVRATYTDRVVVERNGSLFEIPYKVNPDASVEFTGNPVQVITSYVPVTEAVTEGVFAEATRGSNVVMFTESACGRLIDLIA